MQFIGARCQGRDVPKACITRQVGPLNQFEQGNNLMRQAGMDANIAIRTRQRDQIRESRMELLARTLADKA